MAIIRVFPTLLVDTPALRILRYGINDMASPRVHDCRHGMAGYTFIAFPSEAFIGVGGAFRRFAPGHIMIWPPYARLQYGHPAQSWTHHWFCCDGSFVDEYLTGGGLPLGTPFPLQDRQLVSRHLQAIDFEMSRPGMPDPTIVRNHLHNLLIELQRELRGPEGEARTPERWQAIRHYLEDTYHQPHALAELAQMAGLSPSHFCAEFKRLFGLSAIEYLIDLRMHHALRLLHNNNLSVSEVGAEVGYADLFHFSKLFKRRFGCSPRAMRRQLFTPPHEG